MSTRDFYKNLPSFKNFLAIQDDASFTPVPDDWWIVLSDIKNSTEAVRLGQFKQVNMLGAASIVAITNALKDFELPFVFGGDGATMLIHDSDLSIVKLELSRLIRLAQEQFNLELRVGLVNVGTLRKKGFDVSLGKYHVTETTQLAQFCGSGINEAERLVKTRDPAAQLIEKSTATTLPDMNGLSCRLQPFDHRRGMILSIIIRATYAEDSIWIRQNLLPKVVAIMDNNLNLANPVTEQQLKWRWLPETWRTELKLFSCQGFRTLFGKLAMMVLANLSLKWNFKLGPFLPKKYKSEFASQSDFKKFDDCLRFVIDCSLEQHQQIEALLIRAHLDGRIFYGTFRSVQAVTTCFTTSASTGHHLHFVDGFDCGYTQAASQMKAQMAAAK